MNKRYEFQTPHLQMAEIEENKSKRDLMLDRLKNRHPDAEYADDEAIYGQLMDDLDEADQELTTRREADKSLSDMFMRDARSAKFLMDWREGGDPVIALIRQFGTDIKDAVDDPDRLEEIAQANKEYVDRVAQEKELEETYQGNLAQSLEMLEAYQAETGASDDDIDKAMELLVTIVSDGIMGKFSRESVEMAMKAIRHDGDVEAASQEGEIRGRNAKIEAKLRKPTRGDGTAVLNGASGRASQSTPDLGALGRMDGNSGDIWERGSIKRNKHN